MPKGSALPPDASPSIDDIMFTVDLAGPTTKKITLAQLATLLSANITDDSIGLSEISFTEFYRFRATSTATIGSSYLEITSFTEVYDVGNVFASGVFTAPADGDYSFTLNLALANQNATRLEGVIIHGTTTVARGFTDTDATVDDPAVSISVDLRLTTGDTVKVRAYNEIGNASLEHSSFSGRLIALN